MVIGTISVHFVPQVSEMPYKVKSEFSRISTWPFRIKLMPSACFMSNSLKQSLGEWKFWLQKAWSGLILLMSTAYHRSSHIALSFLWSFPLFFYCFVFWCCCLLVCLFVFRGELSITWRITLILLPLVGEKQNKTKTLCLYFHIVKTAPEDSLPVM